MKLTGDGDGVNVAARLTLAPAAGVCITALVHEQVVGKLAADFTDTGEHTVKNIARPIRGFAWHPTGHFFRGRAARARPSLRE